MLRKYVKIHHTYVKYSRQHESHWTYKVGSQISPSPNKSEARWSNKIVFSCKVGYLFSILGPLTSLSCVQLMGQLGILHSKTWILLPMPNLSTVNRAHHITSEISGNSSLTTGKLFAIVFGKSKSELITTNAQFVSCWLLFCLPVDGSLAGSLGSYWFGRRCLGNLESLEQIFKPLRYHYHAPWPSTACSFGLWTSRVINLKVIRQPTKIYTRTSYIYI